MPRQGSESRRSRLGPIISASVAVLLLVGGIIVGAIPVIEAKGLDGHTILAVGMVSLGGLILLRLAERGAAR